MLINKLKRFKKILPYLLIGILFNTASCSSFRVANDKWTGKDKAQHFAFSAAMAMAGNAYADKQNWQHREAAQFGILFSVSLGVVKELYDSRPSGTGWSWHDIAYDVAGSIAGYSLYQSLK
ncbi:MULTISPECIES: YfiM family lipoprotein [Providencia]|uniref:YfiM family lipoprotein n=1 Tax=Providencia stuartii TaxID=588 RepID=A0AAI9MW80_PROST|nr:YfiM family lipoprotein [Providencia stuartii]ELR5045695.1 YfiM family lipoprotein [Providencia rettgeri]MTB40185.1 YfiM family lipoprotein [Providencia sp. wls1949]MTC09378.1 YfiM family lipoprotein [Providencia sp. wls1948]QIC16976.1 YfiM family lipoprotein [Providencia vermicola]